MRETPPPSIAGPELLRIPSPWAEALQRSILRALEVRPPDCGAPDRHLLRLYAALEDLRSFRSETDATPPRVEFVSAATAAERLGITKPGLFKRLANSEIPGARKVDGRWLIPEDALPDPEDEPT